MHPPDPYTHLSPSYPLCKEVKFTSVLCLHTIHPHPGATDQEVPRQTSRHCRAPTYAKRMPVLGPQRLGLQELTVDQPSSCDGPQVASWQRGLQGHLARVWEPYPGDWAGLCFWKSPWLCRGEGQQRGWEV